MTYAMLYLALIEAEERRDNAAYSQQVRDNSAETVSLIEERMRRENITRDDLKNDFIASRRQAR